MSLALLISVRYVSISFNSEIAFLVFEIAAIPTAEIENVSLNASPTCLNCFFTILENSEVAIPADFAAFLKAVNFSLTTVKSLSVLTLVKSSYKLSTDTVAPFICVLKLAISGLIL